MTPVMVRQKQTSLTFWLAALFMCAVVLLSQSITLSPAWAQPPQFLPVHKDPIRVFDANGTYKTQIKIEIADSNQQKTFGLMERPRLPKNYGMLFPYTPPRPLEFWMKNTPEPLDILFISPHGTIQAIHRRTAPHSTSPTYGSLGLSVGALELAGGEAARLKLNIGDQLHHPRLPQ